MSAVDGPVIPDEAVKAVTTVFCEYITDLLDDDVKPIYEADYARRALAAALPLLSGTHQHTDLLAELQELALLLHKAVETPEIWTGVDTRRAREALAKHKETTP